MGIYKYKLYTTARKLRHWGHMWPVQQFNRDNNVSKEEEKASDPPTSASTLACLLKKAGPNIS